LKRRGRNEGSIYLRRDGRWAASVQIGYSGGKRVRKTYYGKTRRDVQRSLTAALHAAEIGALPIRDGRTTLTSFAETWLADLHMSVRPSTQHRYEQLMRLHVLPDLGHMALTKIEPPHVQAVLRAKAKTLSPQTVGHIRAVLRRALNQAMRWGLVSRNVATLVLPPRVTRFAVKPLDAAQARTFLESTRQDRLAALYLVALMTGMRQGELLGLHWSDVDLAAATIHVRHALQRIDGELVLVEPKSVSSRRVLALAPSALGALREHRVRQRRERLLAGSQWEERGLVFTSTIGTPLDSTNVTHRFQRLLHDAGLPRQRFHDLRHACASFLLSQGVHPRVVMETLGHSQISLTMNTYSHVTTSLQQAAASEMELLLTKDGT